MPSVGPEKQLFRGFGSGLVMSAPGRAVDNAVSQQQAAVMPTVQLTVQSFRTLRAANANSGVFGNRCRKVNALPARFC
jgi:hypothetical protein